MNTGKLINDPIAIVGLSCRFPMANNLDEFWNLLITGIDAVTEIPQDRLKIDNYYDPDPTLPGKIQQKHGAFLKEVHHFDPFFFNISPAEAIEMSPSQKLILELVWEAIENSSIPYKKIKGSKTGVYVGNIWSDFEHFRKDKNANATSHSAMGQSSNIIANRVSFTFGFTGPSLVMDTGCSSTLVALHLACQAIWDRSIEIGVIGGVNHILDPEQYVLLTKFGGLSVKGKCSAFDADGDGFVRGEGAGIIMIKPLKKAIEDGDHIYAVIKGSAMNNNGFNENLPATSIKGQLDVLENAYKSSGIKPEDIHYVEAHGTGTKVGDPTETKALGTFFGKNRTKDNFLAIGSVKTNIGHLEAAAGMAGIIKVILAMKNKRLPKNLNFNTPNPNIPFEQLKLSPQTEETPWPIKNGDPLRAGVNSFGWGGTNAHVILEEYQENNTNKDQIAIDGLMALPLSAKDSTSLKNLAAKYLKMIEELPDSNGDLLQRICLATSLNRVELEYRMIFKGYNKVEIIQNIKSFLEENIDIIPVSQNVNTSETVFVFPGQGSQWIGMGKELYAYEPVFKAVIDDCNKAFSKYVQWDLINEILADENTSLLKQIDVIQPYICAVQIALAKLWISKGVVPSAVVGHSMGEIAASYIAGAISLDDAARIICTRSKLMKTLSGTGGAMAVTELTWDEANDIVNESGGNLCVAVYNSPKSTVLAGDQESITKVLATLETKGLFCRQVKVDVASHSSQMDSIKETLRQELSSIKPKDNNIKIYSTVRNLEIKGTDQNNNYWVENLRNTVQFAPVMQKLITDGYSVFMEVSPHPVLTTAVKECADANKSKIISSYSTLRNKSETTEITKNLIYLYCNGCSIEWNKYYKIDKAPFIQLPSYPFQRENYEIEDRSNELESSSNSTAHPILGDRLVIADENKIHIWENKISINKLPYLKGHKVCGTIVYPGAAYIEAALTAVQDIYGHGKFQLQNIQYLNSVVLNEKGSVTIQCKVIEKDSNNLEFKFYSKTQKDDGNFFWTILVEGELILNNEDIDIKYIQPINNIKSDCKFWNGDKYYELLNQIGLQYSGYFSGIKNINLNGNIATSSISANKFLLKCDGVYNFHPALLDSCLQILFAKSVEETSDVNEKSTFLTKIGRITQYSAVDYTKEIFVTANFKNSPSDNNLHLQTIVADIVIYQENGEIIASIENASAGIMDSRLIQQEQNNLNEWLYKTEWIKTDLTLSSPSLKPSDSAVWIIIGDVSGVADQIIAELNNKHHKSILELSDSFVDLDAQFTRLSANKIKISGIIVCRSLSSSAKAEVCSAIEIQNVQTKNSLLLINIAKALSAHSEISQPKIVFVTKGLLNIGNDTIPEISNAAAWGVAKVFSNELTENYCLRIDLPIKHLQKDIEVLTNIFLLEKNTESEIALQQNSIYGSRLIHYKEDDLNLPKMQFHKNATYLITGFKGLGIELIKWMIESGAQHFVLSSRSGNASAEAMLYIESLKLSGIDISIVKADVACFTDMHDIFNNIDNTMPPLKGVFHLAGLIEPCAINKINDDAFDHIITPKIQGAWNLHLLTLNRKLDCFVLFSSASSLIGLSGQASYVAGNTFLDFLSQYRKKLKLPSLAINWGVMKDVGMVANIEELDKFAKAEGFEFVSMVESLKILEKIANTSQPQIGIFKINAEQMASYYSSLGNYMSELLRKNETANNLHDNLLDTLQSLQSEDERLKFIESIIITNVASLIKAPVSKINPCCTFKSLGIDSIMAVQLRNSLEKVFLIKIAVASLWQKPVIRDFAFFVNNAIADKTKQNGDNKTIKCANPWFVPINSKSDSKLQLYCFHDAGGSSNLFSEWDKYFNADVEVIGVELPGRGDFNDKMPYTDYQLFMKDFITEIIQNIGNKQFAIYGHSMGGLLAYETARQLHKNHGKEAISLIISGTPSLNGYVNSFVNSIIESAPNYLDLVKYLPNPSIIDLNNQIYHNTLKTLLADFTLLYSYKHINNYTLRCNVLAFGARYDDRVKLSDVKKWKDETSANYSLIEFDGDHFFVYNNKKFVAETINNHLIALLKNKISINITNQKLHI